MHSRNATATMPPRLGGHHRRTRALARQVDAFGATWTMYGPAGTDAPQRWTITRSWHGVETVIEEAELPASVVFTFTTEDECAARRMLTAHVMGSKGAATPIWASTPCCLNRLHLSSAAGAVSTCPEWARLWASQRGSRDDRSELGAPIGSSWWTRSRRTLIDRLCDQPGRVDHIGCISSP